MIKMEFFGKQNHLVENLTDSSCFQPEEVKVDTTERDEDKIGSLGKTC